MTDEQFLSREEAVAWLRKNYGFRLKVGTLAIYACQGRGPRYHRAGNRCAYTINDLRDWAEKRLSGVAA